jgi:excisionase family DNA binding protein
MYAEQTNPGVQYTYGLPKVMTVEEAAEFLRINVKTLYAAVESKDVPALKLGKRIVILRDALLESLRGRKFVKISGKRSA